MFLVQSECIFVLEIINNRISSSQILSTGILLQPCLIKSQKFQQLLRPMKNHKSIIKNQNRESYETPPVLTANQATCEQPPMKMSNVL